MRVEAIDFVDDAHRGAGGGVGGVEQLAGGVELASFRGPPGQGVERDHLGLVIPDERKTLKEGAIKTLQTPAWKENQDDLVRYGAKAGIKDPNKVVSALAVNLNQSANNPNVVLGTNIKLTRGMPP